MRLGSDRRVRKHAEFQLIQKAGKRIVSPNFVFVVANAPKPDALPRLGITVTRRVGNSVRRSRIKRIVRAAFQTTEGLLPPGYDLIVICRQDRPDLGRADVVEQFNKSANKLKRVLAELRAQLPSPQTRQTT